MVASSGFNLRIESRGWFALFWSRSIGGCMAMSGTGSSSTMPRSLATSAMLLAQPGRICTEWGSFFKASKSRRSRTSSAAAEVRKVKTPFICARARPVIHSSASPAVRTRALPPRAAARSAPAADRADVTASAVIGAVALARATCGDSLGRRVVCDFFRVKDSLDLLARERVVALQAQEPHAARGHDAVVLIDDARLPHLRALAARDGRRDGTKPDPDPHRADEAGVVLEADHVLTAWEGEERGADGGERFDQTAVHASVHDPVALQMLRPGDKLGAHLVLGREGDRDPHRLEPALGQLIQARRIIFHHDCES